MLACACDLGAANQNLPVFGASAQDMKGLTSAKSGLKNLLAQETLKKEASMQNLNNSITLNNIYYYTNPFNFIPVEQVIIIIDTLRLFLRISDNSIGLHSSKFDELFLIVAFKMNFYHVSRFFYLLYPHWMNTPIRFCFFFNSWAQLPRNRQ